MMFARPERQPRRPTLLGLLLGRRLLLPLALGLIIEGGVAWGASPPLDPDTQALLVAAVETATALDAYNARCRNDNAGAFINNLNKELARRLRLTVMIVQDDLFPERGFRKAQARMQQGFQEALRQAGGCTGAKASDMPQQLRTRMDSLNADIEALP